MHMKRILLILFVSAIFFALSLTFRINDEF
jgi:hypothetical protein